MRILYVTGDWKWTGPAEPMLSAASGLRAHGHRVELAFPVAPDGVAGALDARARERDLDPVLRLERRRGFLPLRDRDEVRRLRALLVEGRHAVVHAYHTRAHLLALFAARGLATRVVTTWTHGEPLPRAPWRRLRLAPRWTDGLDVLSEGIAASARGIGWPPDRVAIVPGVVDTERFRPREASEELRAALGIDPGERVLGVVARIQPHRRFGLLLEALERTRRVAPGLRLLVVGRGTRADGRPIPAGVKLIHINADPADLNKIYQADVPILADAKLALRDLIDAVRDRLGPGRGGIKEEVVADIQQAKAKWLGEWESIFTDESTPTNGYRVVHDLMQVVDLDRTIAIHDAGGSRGYLSPFWEANKPRNYIGMGGMAAMGWSMGAAVGAWSPHASWGLRCRRSADTRD